MADEMRLSLAAAKESRKQAELDAQLLANRIALLKLICRIHATVSGVLQQQEEARAWKKIEETRRRAQELETIKLRQEQRQQEREEALRERVRQVKDAQSHNLLLREQAQQKRDEARMKNEQRRREEARRAKESQAKAAQDSHLQACKERYYNHERSVRIRQQQMDLKKRREEEQRKRAEKTQEEYEARVAKEEMIRARTEALVAKLEKEEMELIQRLQNTQTYQQTAYQQLDEALGDGASAISTTKARENGTSVERKQKGLSPNKNLSIAFVNEA